MFHRSITWATEERAQWPLVWLIEECKIDPLIKVKNAYSAHALISSSELKIVEGMGHLLDEESYGQFQSKLITFLQKKNIYPIYIIIKRIYRSPKKYRYKFNENGYEWNENIYLLQWRC